MTQTNKLKRNIINILMEKYSFYRIYCKDENIIDNYVGSTSNLKNRLRHHLEVFNDNEQRGYYRKIYTIIRENGGFENWEMEELFIFDCDVKEARKIEQKLIDEYKPTLNTYRAYTCEETRRIRHIETNKLWRQLNLEHRRKYEYDKYTNDKTWRQRKINSAKKYYENHIEERKLYKDEFYKNNKEKLLDKQKKYHEKNRDEINRRARERTKQKKELKLMGLEDKRII
jgi:hypothetical protein